MKPRTCRFRTKEIVSLLAESLFSVEKLTLYEHGVRWRQLQTDIFKQIP